VTRLNNSHVRRRLCAARCRARPTRRASATPAAGSSPTAAGTTVRRDVTGLSLQLSRAALSAVSRAACDATGYIRLELPVFHVGYFKNIVAILQCVCKTCAHVMVPEDERRQYLRRFRNPATEARIRARARGASSNALTRRTRAGEHAACAVQKADGALQALQDLPVLRRLARRARRGCDGCFRAQLR
jgi:DNA-directed RNA polymerase beta' subunit